jgi:hypothetical protein
LGRGVPADYPTTLAATWRVAIGSVSKDDAIAADLLRALAFVDSEKFPLAVLVQGADRLPPALAAAVADDLALDEHLGVLLRHSLVSRQQDTLSTHRSLRAICASDLDPAEAQAWVTAALRCLVAALPDDVEQPSSWPACAALLSTCSS